MVGAMSGVFQGFDISATGLRAEMARSEIVSSNLVNMHRTGNSQQEPYRRKIAVFEEVLNGEISSRDTDFSGGARVVDVVDDSSPFPAFYQPGHPDADEKGMVLGSNVELFQELADMQVISRSVDANLAAMRTYKAMLQKIIDNMGK